VKTVSVFLPFLLAITMSACHRTASQKALDGPPAPVEVAAAELRTMPIEMRAIGAVEAAGERAA
jgi:hypothetical protein